MISFSSHTGQFAVVNGLAIGNGNQFSRVYAATNLTLNVIAGGGAGAAGLRYGTDVDTDGDGAPDDDELLAGTDLLDAASVFRITAIEQTAADVEFTFNTVLGKNYRLEFSPDLSAGSWTTVSGSITGTGQPLIMTDAEPLRHGRRFYRIAVIATGE